MSLYGCNFKLYFFVIVKFENVSPTFYLVYILMHTVKKLHVKLYIIIKQLYNNYIYIIDNFKIHY